MPVKKIVLFAILWIGFFITSSSCNKIPSGGSDLIETPGELPEDSTNIYGVEQSLTLNFDTAVAEVGDTIVIQPTFGKVAVPQREYTWEVDSGGVIKQIAVEDDYSIKLRVEKAGFSKVTIKSKDEALEATCIIKVNFKEDGIIRILAIGNSFSVDALEHYFHGLADAAGIQVIIGNMYIGGASLELHWSNASQNLNAYDFRVIDVNGNKTNTPNTSISKALSSAPWDYVSLQQVSYQTGLYNTYIDPLPKLYDYVKGRLLKSGSKIIFHQIWAYQQGANHSGFANYNNDQMTMYDAIVDAVWKAALLRDFDKIVPSGTAIQNGRATLLGDNFTRDGFHLNSLGQYTASCTWFEAIFGENVVGNTFAPGDLTPEQVEIAQHVAHAAIEHPKEVTALDEYAPSPSMGIQNAPVYIGFGSENIGNYPGWNAFAESSGLGQGSQLNNLVDFDGVNTGVSIEVTEPFNGRNNSGANGVSLFGINIPDDIASHSYYGNSKKDFGGKTVIESKLKISGLDKNQKYDFCFFGCRNGVSDNRETKYIVTGANTSSGVLNTSSNSSESVCVTGIQPDINGEVVITVTSGENNTNSFGFFYLSLLRISKFDGAAPSGIQNAPVFVGFGSDNISNHSGWNAFEGGSNAYAGSKIEDLIDYDNRPTGVSVEITESFNGRNSGGVSSATIFGMTLPSDICKNAYYGNAKKEFGGKTVVESKLKISGLDKSQKYDFCFFGSRNGVSDNRESKYIVAGTTSATVALNTSNNTNNTVCATGIQPDNNGEVTVIITAGENNTNGYGFFYLSVMQISKN